ncbi:ABC transporter [Micromonospora sp. KC606]|uniref:ABC transporter n=1 Tax=Micromonospora sp. KC606 TaxID=2530379 RepID=UPI0010450EAE|nr:ABC transporter [Micromonospora sp. KC606]TDC84195.1 ABC transporter [Micromonospora sp. KC606]
MSVRVVPRLFRPVARAMPWWTFLAAAGLGLAIVTVPAATAVTLTGEDLVGLLRVAAVCGALGVGFLLDDPAARSIATVPTPRPVRYAARAGVILPAAAVWWALVLAVTVAGAEDGIGATLPLGGVTVEAAALGGVALAVAAVRLRGRPDSGGLLAFPVLLGLVMAARLLPDRMALFVPPDDTEWARTHERWAVLLVVAVAVSTWASQEPARRWTAVARRRRSLVGHRRS